jgi:ParB-like chromosome segregation protein Spo0J
MSKQFTVEIRDIETIKPYAHNPRLNDGAVDAVAASLKEFGFRQPIVVDADGIILCGHTRYKAARKLGLPKVPVHVAKDLTPEQSKAYRIADNQTADLAEWDYDILPIELADLMDAGFDMDLLGFDEKELTQLLNAEVNQGNCDPDEIPEPPDEPITQLGDLWILGNHRLLCGDAGSEADLDRLLDGNLIHLVNMDPPYNVCPMYPVAA